MLLDEIKKKAQDFYNKKTNSDSDEAVIKQDRKSVV